MTRVPTTALMLMAALSAVAELAELPYGGQVVVDRLLDSEWHQRRPFNDFMPVDWADMPSKGTVVKNESKRGRMLCGCVADAAGQIMRHFAWPPRLDRTVTVEHDWWNQRGTNIVDGVTNTAALITGKVRYQVVGHVPFDYESMTNAWAAAFADARGKAPERNRYATARMTLAAGVLLRSRYGTDETTSNSFSDFADGLNDWYEEPGKAFFDTDYAGAKKEVLSCLSNGIPVAVTMEGHQVVIHGWATVNGEDYACFACDGGWENDGWHSVESAGLRYATTWFRPRRKPQAEPLRAVEDARLTVKWAFPKLWQDQVRGFTVTASSGGTSVSKAAGKEDRSVTFENLTAGAAYSFAVTPDIDGGETSPSVTTTIATVAKPALAWPTIEVWGPTTNAFGETWYHENALGMGFVYVRCPTSVTNLAVVSGNLTALPQEKIVVRQCGDGLYAVVFDGSSVSNVPCSHGTISMNRQRMIATLVATDVNGTTFCKDLSLRFSSETPIAEPDGLTPTPVIPVVPGTNVVVAPLCKAMWNQGRHYNRMAPVTDALNCPDGRMWAGCTAVATAILMKHYEWPPQGETWYQSLNDEKSWANDNTAIALRARFDEPYAWDKMQDVYGNVTGSEASMAVAQLMSDIGAVMNMNYGVNGSSTLRENVAGVLEHNFRFDASQLYQVNNNFTPEVEARIQAQLEAGHPIISAGKAGASQTGHTYVCDGFARVVDANGTTNNLYHFNFGWGGTSNGWYPLTAVFTSAKPGEAAVETPVESMLLGVYPQREPLIGASPDVSGPRVELAWSIARCWTDGLERIVVEDQVKGEPVERSDELSGDDWFIHASDGNGYGWTKDNGKVTGKMTVFHSYYGDEYYWPGQGGGFFSDKPVTVSTETDVEIRYAARHLPPGVKLEVVRCKWDEGMQTYIDHDGNYNFYEPFATLEGGTSQTELTERTVTIPGSVVAQAFDGGEDNAHFCIRFPYGECTVASYTENTVVFRLDSFSVKGKAESWETARSVELAPTARSHVFEDASVTNHRFVVSARYADKTVSSSVKKTVCDVAPVQPAVALVAADGQTLTYEVSNTTDYSYEFVTQSNALRGNHRKNGGTVTYTLANPLADVGTHWVTICVTDNKTGMKAKHVHYTNPSPSHPLCAYVEPSVGAAAARAKKEGKLVLLMQSGDPDAAKFMALSGILASNEVVDVISRKYVLTEVIASVPEQQAVGRAYWRSQPQFGTGQTSYQPTITAYATVINPENAAVPYPCADLPASYMNAYARWSYFNSQYDMPNLGSSYYVASATSDLIRFLKQSGFVVTVPAEEDEAVPTIEEGELVGTIVRNADGEYVVSPVANGAFVSVNCVGTNTIVVPPSVIGFMGVPLAQLKVKAGSLDLTGAFLPQDVGDGAYYLMLDETASVQVGEELITVQPQLTGATEPIKPFVIGATASVGVKTIPGLKYTLWRGTDLDGLMSEVQAQTTDWIVEKVADSTRTKLTDANPPAGQAFYVIQVEQPSSAGQP